MHLWPGWKLVGCVPDASFDSSRREDGTFTLLHPRPLFGEIFDSRSCGVALTREPHCSGELRDAGLNAKPKRRIHVDLRSVFVG